MSIKYSSVILDNITIIYFLFALLILRLAQKREDAIAREIQDRLPESESKKISRKEKDER